MHRLLALAFVAVGLAFTACGGKPPAASSPAKDTRKAEQVFAVKGILKKLAVANRTATIQHEEIPNYMPAMTMPFSVRDTNELRAVQVGDAISFQLHVTEEESWIGQIQKVEPVVSNTPPERPAFRLVKDVEPLKVGDRMPDYRFTNELGRAVRLRDFKGTALALTFIFTRCPLPEYCPLMSRNFAAAQKQLAARPGGPTNWHLLSISFDPDFDTPVVLKRYAQALQHDPRHWSFATGALIDIDAITEQFELPVVKQGESFEHKLRTVVIDARGRIQKIFLGNKWTVEELVGEVLSAANAKDGEPGSSR